MPTPSTKRSGKSPTSQAILPAYADLSSAAVPQVALPGWADCYDYACRAELNGVGKWANKKAKGTWERNEVAESLEEVIIGPKAAEYQQTAKAVAKRHPENEGRERAAREILALGK